jgi:hypothetical protein
MAVIFEMAGLKIAEQYNKILQILKIFYQKCPLKKENKNSRKRTEFIAYP